ncbi:MAG: hypothetical protein K0U16_07665 [Gammaproteobacteria bacterium]|nr:hypothetical protein [Gammaproteobacteria bacterium]
MTVRTYRVEVRGFDFKYVWVRSETRGRARAICAKQFVEAGWGTMKEGLEHVVSARIDDEADVELIYHRRGPEGVCRLRGREHCPETGLPCDQRCPDPDCARLRHPHLFRNI